MWVKLLEHFACLLILISLILTISFDMAFPFYYSRGGGMRGCLSVCLFICVFYKELLVYFDCMA